ESTGERAGVDALRAIPRRAVAEDRDGEREDHQLLCRAHEVKGWPASLAGIRFASVRTRTRIRRDDGWDRRRALRIQLEDRAGMDPQPEQRLLRFAIVAEDGVSSGTVERLAHRGERVA